MTVDLRCAGAAARQFAPALRIAATSLLGLLSMPSAELSIVLTGDAAIRKLNRDCRGKDVATDVLAFPQLDQPFDGTTWGSLEHSCPDETDRASPPIVLGDIVISVETATRQARAMGLEPAHRVRDLLIHGFLHLLGYDHERSAVEARRMYARARQLAASLELPSNPRGSVSAIVHHARERA